MSQSTHRFVLEMDAQQAKRVAKEFRQAIEAELGGIGSSTGSSPLANVQKSVEQISKTEMFTDATRRAEQLENVMRRIRDLSSQVQNMDIKFEPNTARWNAQVEEFYRKVEQAMGTQQANLARGRNVIPNVGAVGAEFVKDTIPVEEWSVKGLRTAEEVKRMGNEYNKVFAELSQAQAQRIRLEIEGVEEEIRTVTDYTSQVAEGSTSYRIAQKNLQDLAETKERLVKEEASELASYQKAMQEYIANDVRSIPQDGPAATTRLTVSKDTVANMERLTELLQQAEGFQKSIAASTQAQSQSISAELAERRQLLEAEYQGRLKILESERSTLKATSEVAQEEADKENARKIGLNTSKQALIIEQEKLEATKKTTKEIERQTEAQKRARAEANRDYAKANTATEQIRAGRDEAIIVQKGLDVLKAEQQTQKQSERNNLESEKRKTYDKKVEAAKRTEEERRQSAETRADKQKEVISHREAEERMTAITKEEERRRTATHVQELRERNQQAQRAQTQISGWFRNTAQDLVYGGLGLYGADQVVQRLYDFGKQGAQQLRTMETFNNLAEQVGTNADDMLEAIQGASRGTISEFNAMSYASQVFSLKFAKDVDDVDGDMEVIIRGARRFSQIFTDEFGKALSIEEIFSRLLKYVREGNKELVDQFGITNQGIADALGVPNEGLRDAEGAVLRWQGLVKVIEEQLGRLGEATDSEADRFERAEARISDSVNRLRQAAAEPIAFTIEYVEKVVRDNTTRYDLVGDDLQDRQRISQPLRQLAGNTISNQRISDFDAQQDIAEIDKFSAKIEDVRKDLATPIHVAFDQGELSFTSAQSQLEDMNSSLTLVSEEFARAKTLADAGVLSQSAYQMAVSELHDILSALQQGNIEYETAEVMINNVHNGLLNASSVFSFMIPQAWEFANAVTASADALAAVVGGQGQLASTNAALQNPSLAALNAMGATGTSFQVTQGTVNRGVQINLAAGRRQAQNLLVERQEEARVRSAVEKYEFSRLPRYEQYNVLSRQRRDAVAAGAPQWQIDELTLEMRKLNESMRDAWNADLDQAEAIREQTRFDLMSDQERLDYLNARLQSDTFTDVGRAQTVAERDRLQADLDKKNAEQRQRDNEERSRAFVETTGERIQNINTYQGQLDYLGSVAMQAQGTLAEEGINNLIQEVLGKQGQLDEQRWRGLFERSPFAVQQQMLLEKISSTTDESERYGLQRELSSLLERWDTSIQQGEESAAREEARLAESKRSADLAALDDQGQLNYLKDYIGTLEEGTEEYYDTLKDINSLEKRLAEESAREATQAWDKAAQDMAKSFEAELSKVMNIPGVLSPSAVTEQDMIDASYGMYRENADEWLRRAKDELVNGVDRPDVDPGRIAEMLGLPGGLPGEVLYGRLEGAWADQSLFANPDNLGLLNTDAIMSRYMDIKNGEIGRQNLEDYIAQTLQISVGEASMIAGTQAPLIQQLTGGQSGAEMAAQLTSIQNEVMGNLDSNFVETIASGWQKDIDQNIAKLDPLADAMADRINGRLTEKLGELTGLVDSVVTRVLELLAEEEDA